MQMRRIWHRCADVRPHFTRWRKRLISRGLLTSLILRSSSHIRFKHAKRGYLTCAHENAHTAPCSLNLSSPWLSLWRSITRSRQLVNTFGIKCSSYKNERNCVHVASCCASQLRTRGDGGRRERAPRFIRSTARSRCLFPHFKSETWKWIIFKCRTFLVVCCLKQV